MASSSYPNQFEYRGFFPLPPVTATTTQASRPTSWQSPWSASSQVSAEHLSLTLPSISPGDLAEDPSLYERLQSPSSYIPESPVVVATHSPPQHPPSTMPQIMRHNEPYEIADSDSPDPFFNFEGASQPQSPPRSPIPRSSRVVDLTQSSPVNMIASTRKRKSIGEEPHIMAKRRRDASPTAKPETLDEKQQIEELDLVEVDDDQKYEDFRAQQQADLIKQQNQEKADKPVKLTDFQCIICLDNPTDLTVTHCGHLFCSLCLHEALHAGTQRKTCPVCRQQINLTKNKEGKQPKNGVFLLEMKLMTARRKEKLPQDKWR